MSMKLWEFNGLDQRTGPTCNIRFETVRLGPDNDEPLLAVAQVGKRMERVRLLRVRSIRGTQI